MTIRVPLLVVISKNDWPCQVTVIFLASAAAALPAASTTTLIAINRRDISGTPEGGNESAWMIPDEEAAWQAPPCLAGGFADGRGEWTMRK